MLYRVERIRSGPLGKWLDVAIRTLAMVAALMLLTALQVPFATTAHAQVTCPLPGAFGNNERFTFDEGAGTCVASSIDPPSGNGFKLLVDDDDLELDQVRTNAVANGDFDTAGDYALHSLTAVSVTPTTGGTITGVKNAGSGNFGLEFDSNTGPAVRTYVFSFTKAGTAYTITLIGQFENAVNPVVTSIVISGGNFTAAPAVVPRNDVAIRQQTQRVIANFLGRRADQITLSEPNLIDRLRRRAGASAPVNLTANGTGANNQVAFSTSLRQIASAARNQKAQKAAKLEGSMALGALGADSSQGPLFVERGALTSSFDIWTQGRWGRVDEDTAESDLSVVHFGADYKVNPNLLIGLMGQWDWMDQSSDTSGISAEGQGWMAGPYLAARLHQNLFFDARAAWGQSDNDVNPLGTYTDNFQTERWLARAKLTGDFAFGDWKFNPHAALIYFREDQEAYVNQLGITIPDQVVSLGRVTFGPKVSYRYRGSGGMVIEPHLAFSGIWDFDSVDTVNIQSGLVTGSDKFRGRLEGGVSAFLANGWSIEGTGYFDGIGTGQFDAYGASLAVNAPLVLPTDGYGDVAKTSVAGITVDLIALKRDGLRDVPFTGPSNGNPANAFVAFTSDELEGKDFTPAIRGTVAAHFLNQPIEISGFFMNTMEQEATKLNLGQEPGNPANTNTIYAAENDPNASINSTNSDNIFGLAVHHQTKLYGAEINALNPFGIPGLSVGTRGIYYGEELATHSIEEEDDLPGGADTNPDRDQVTVRTDNKLFGIQAGLQGMFDVTRYLSVGGSVKGGLYVNQVDRQRTFRSQNVPARRLEDETSENVFAQAVEVNPRVELRLSETMTLSAAGTFLWLNNVSDTLSHYATVTSLSDSDVRANEDVFFYGGSLGLKIALANGIFGSNRADAPALMDPAASLPDYTYEDLDARVAELEATTVRKGVGRINMGISGWVNYGVLAYDDGYEDNAAVVNFTSSRSRIRFDGSVKIARGWSAGYNLHFGINDADSNDISQLTDDGDDVGLALRQSNWWIRNNTYGTITVGHGSTATDNIILHDTGGIAPGVQNIATIGGGLLVRHSDETVEGSGALITRTTMNDFAGGASVDTLRRNNIRYDAPRITALGGRVNLSAAWGEDDFYDVALRYAVNWNDFKLRTGVGYLHDTDEPDSRVGTSERDRQEFKGSASIIHIPTGIFMTAAFVHREFAGTDPSNQAIFGENTTGIVSTPGSNRPDIEYRYFASGLRAQFSGVGDTTIYGEYGRVDDAITGLREAGLFEVTDSRLEMVGVAVSQDIDAAGMDIYAGARHIRFHTEGVITQTSPEPLTDHMLFFAGSRVKF